MLALKFVRLIENHAEELAQTLAERVKSSHKTKSFHNVPEGELRERTYQVYRDLGEWLLERTDVEIDKFYSALGARRAEQGVTASDFMWAMVITKENLWDFLRSEAVADRALELLGELELLLLMEQFFDRAMYFSLQGYEQYMAKQKHAAA